MAREIRGVSPSGTLYARIMNSAGLWWNGTTFEAYTAANWANYDVAMTEQGDSDLYVADFPAGITAGGDYEYFVHQQAGGSPAEGDDIINTGRVEWGGTSVVTPATGSMTGAEWLTYLIGRGFVRTDKNTEIFRATVDAIQEMRRLFDFDEAKEEVSITDTLTTLGEYKLDLDSDFGRVIGLKVEDGTDGSGLTKVSKERFDELYPNIPADTSDRGYPMHYCIFGGQILIGPVPDSISYVYRVTHSIRAGSVDSTTVGVPFTALYRSILACNVLSRLYEDLDEFDKSVHYRGRYEAEMPGAVRKERINAGQTSFNMIPRDC
jgi:hypothetical protein